MVYSVVWLGYTIILGKIDKTRRPLNRGIQEEQGLGENVSIYWSFLLATINLSRYLQAVFKIRSSIKWQKSICVKKLAFETRGKYWKIPDGPYWLLRVRYSSPSAIVWLWSVSCELKLSAVMVVGAFTRKYVQILHYLNRPHSHTQWRWLAVSKLKPLQRLLGAVWLLT